jgi:hypothetical protein
MSNKKSRNKDNAFMWLIFLYYYQTEIQKLSSVWNSFENDIINHHRFFPNNEVIDEINNYVKTATISLKKDTILFRARIFDGQASEKFLDFYKDVLRENGIDLDSVKDDIYNSCALDTDISLLQFIDESKCNDENTKYAIEALRRYKASNFKGYNAQESMPPTSNISAGRANPDNIRYLYVCEDEVTPIYEIKPSIGQNISLAKLKLNRDVTLYDLTINTINEDIMPTLFYIIEKKFSLPNYGDLTKYYSTQYIAEMLNNKGFDGIRFNSSLNEGGKNIVLFNVDDCRVVSSKLLEVSKINIETKTPSIYDDIKKSN